MRHLFSTLSRKRAGRQRLILHVAALPVVAMLLLQWADLSHAHDSLAQELDCEICLGLGVDDPGPVSEKAQAAHWVARQNVTPQVSSLRTAAPLRANSRAPPRA